MPMLKRFKGCFVAFYLIHRFNYMSIRIALAVTRCFGLLFYQARGLAVLIDSVLSLAFYATALLWLGGVLTHHRGDIRVMGPLSVALLFFVWLKRRERREKRFVSFRPFSIYNVDVGSAKTMRGGVTILHCFVNTGWRRWNRNRMDKAKLKVLRAAEWLQGQAQLYKVDLHFSGWDLPDVRAGYDQEIPNYNNEFRDMPRSHAHIRECVVRLAPSVLDKELPSGANIAVIVHVLYKIRSYAVPENLGEAHAKTQFEYAVVEYGQPPSTYAHELLHLFGADDYYDEYSETMMRMKIPYLAKSIMFFGGVVPLKRLTVDELTAQNIGWM